MRLIAAVAAAAVLAGFTVQDAEQTLNGEWAGGVFAIGLELNAKAKTGKLTEGGKVTTGPLEIKDTSGGAVTISIAGRPFVIHIRDNGGTLLFSPQGKNESTILKRVR